MPAIKKEEIPFELPEGWTWCRLGSVCSKTGSGSTPKGGKTAYVENGIKFIRSQNVYDEGLIINGIVFVLNKTHEKMKGTKVISEDLLLNITGGSPYFQKMIIEAQTGAGKEGLPKNKMDNILIPLPTEKEQKIIVKKLNRLK